MVLALMNLVCGGACLLVAAGGLTARLVFLVAPAGMYGPFGWGTFLLIGAGCLFLGLFSLTAGIGLWKLRNRSRQMQISLFVLLSAFEFFAMLGAVMHLALWLAIFRLLVLGGEVWILIYLFKPSVKEAFGIASGRTGESSPYDS